MLHIYNGRQLIITWRPTLVHQPVCQDSWIRVFNKNKIKNNKNIENHIELYITETFFNASCYIAHFVQYHKFSHIIAKFYIYRVSNG